METEDTQIQSGIFQGGSLSALLVNRPHRTVEQVEHGLC
jgi:hypothetical protein